MSYVQDTYCNNVDDISTSYDSGTETASINKYGTSGEYLRNSRDSEDIAKTPQFFSVLHRLRATISESLLEMETLFKVFNYEELIAENALLNQNLIEQDKLMRQIKHKQKIIEEDNEIKTTELKEYHSKSEKLKIKMKEKTLTIDALKSEVRNLSEKMTALETEHNKRINTLMKSKEIVEQKDDIKVPRSYIKRLVGFYKIRWVFFHAFSPISSPTGGEGSPNLK